MHSISTEEMGQGLTDNTIAAYDSDGNKLDQEGNVVKDEPTFERVDTEKYQIAKASHFIQMATKNCSPDVTISTETARLLIECYGHIRKLGVHHWKKPTTFMVQRMAKTMKKLNQPHN